MKKSKKLLAVLLVCVMAISLGVLTGCGSSKDDSAKDESWDYVEKNGKLIIGLDDTFAPMGFRDQDNNIVGFDIDLAKAVGEKLGVEVEFQPIDWKAKEANLKSKKIDCIWNGLSATPDREKSMTLSKKYMENRILLMSLDKNVNVTDVDQLKDMKIGTQAGSAALEQIEKNEKYDDFKDNIKEYDTYDQALLDMKAGRIDVVAIDEVYAIYNNQSKETLYESEFNFGADYYAIAFRKGDDALAEKVNGAIKELEEDGTAKKISEQWFGKDLTIYE